MAQYLQANRFKKLDGEQYTDIDFDGQFDVKEVCKHNPESIDFHVFINGGWQKMDWVDIPSYTTAGLKIGPKKVFYDFEPCKG